MTIRLFKNTFLVCLMLFSHSLEAQTSDNNWNPALAGQYPSTDVYCSAVVGNYAYIGGLFLEVGGNTNLKI